MTPEDVYYLILHRSSYTQNLIIAVIVLVSVLFAVAAPASVMFLYDARDRRRQYKRNQDLYAQNRKLLEWMERHAELTDASYKRKAEMIADEVRHLLELKQAAREVKQDVGEVKDKVTAAADTIAKIDERLPEFPSGTLTLQPGGQPQPVDPANPPKRRAEDRKP